MQRGECGEFVELVADLAIDCGRRGIDGAAVHDSMPDRVRCFGQAFDRCAEFAGADRVGSQILAGQQRVIIVEQTQFKAA